MTTLAEAQQLVTSGASGFVRMISDTEDIDQSFLAQLRALNVAFVPLLSLTRPEQLPIAMRNTKRMASAGVPIAVGSGGSSPATLHETVDNTKPTVVMSQPTTGARANGPTVFPPFPTGMVSRLDGLLAPSPLPADQPS